MTFQKKPSKHINKAKGAFWSSHSQCNLLLSQNISHISHQRTILIGPDILDLILCVLKNRILGIK